jgi:hypothetical protein
MIRPTHSRNGCSFSDNRFPGSTTRNESKQYELKIIHFCYSVRRTWVKQITFDLRPSYKASSIGALFSFKFLSFSFPSIRGNFVAVFTLGPTGYCRERRNCPIKAGFYLFQVLLHVGLRISSKILQQTGSFCTGEIRSIFIHVAEVSCLTKTTNKTKCCLFIRFNDALSTV